MLGAAGLLLEAVAGGVAPRAGVLLLSPLAVWKGAAEPRLDRLPCLAAALFLFVLLLWALPAWQPTGEAITIEGVVQAILPGAWARCHPTVAADSLSDGNLPRHIGPIARNAGRPATALAAGVPVRTLAVTYAQVARFQRDATWALVAAVIAAGLAAAAARARWQGGVQRAGVHAAGALAALALGCAMVLHDHWLTLAIALFLAPLRRLALVVAGVVLVRLLLNPAALSYDCGTTPLLNGLALAYGVPAAGFALAAVMFRWRSDDRTVAALEAGTVALTVALVGWRSAIRCPAARCWRQ